MEHPVQYVTAKPNNIAVKVAELPEVVLLKSLNRLLLSMAKCIEIYLNTKYKGWNNGN